MDPVTVGTTTLALVNGAYDAEKRAVSLAKEVNNQELKTQVGDVLIAILDFRVRVMDLDEENRTLKARLEAKETVKFNHRWKLFFKEGERTPLCPTCLQKDDRQVYLQDGVNHDRVICKVCQNSFPRP